MKIPSVGAIARPPKKYTENDTINYMVIICKNKIEHKITM